MRQPCLASEQISLEQTLERLANDEVHARTLLSRLSRIADVPHHAKVLDVGAAQGRFLIACTKQGYEAVGVEPCTGAIVTAYRLAERLSVPVHIVGAVAEALPLVSEQFDVVHARSVIEHVGDPQAAFNEAYRVLKPGGVFYFSAASSVCPRQAEIRAFPCFGWYPERLKRRIMEWAKTHKPHLIGYTQTPAINWFSPWKARRMLRAAGFRQVYDRWDLGRLGEREQLRRIAFSIIGSCRPTKLLADVLRPGCAYAAVK